MSKEIQCKNCMDTGLIHREKTLKRGTPEEEKVIVVDLIKGNARVCQKCKIAAEGKLSSEIIVLCDKVALIDGDVVYGITILSGGLISPYYLLRGDIPEIFQIPRKKRRIKTEDIQCAHCLDTGLIFERGVVKVDKGGNARICNSCNIAKTGNFYEIHNDMSILNDCDNVEIEEGDNINGKIITKQKIISIDTLLNIYS